jgi:ribonuclease BN (tRNA processing enzyme)
MEITFLGVGEAFDEALPNTSMLIRCGEDSRRRTFLLDLGFTVPPQFWKAETSVEDLDAIWISHFHADHFFGLPALLVRFWEDGRKNPLTILGQRGIETSTRRCVDLAYPGFYEKIRFPIEFQEVEPNHGLEFLGVSLQTAENEHSIRDLALRLEAEGCSLFYSGDGRATPETKALAKGTQILIHEAFHQDQAIHGHATVQEALDMAKGCEASHLALVHIQRRERKRVLTKIQALRDLAGPVNLMVPEPGQSIEM